MQFYFDAFLELQTERQMGMAAGKIPWRAIVSFAHHYGIYDTDNVETLIRHIRAMEYVLIKHESKKNDG